MKLLVSFCNPRGPETPQLALFNWSNFNQALHNEDPDLELMKFFNVNKGATGLTKKEDDSRFYAISQSRPTLYKFDWWMNLQKMQDVSEWVKDPHSIAFDKDRILVASTGTNSIQEFDTELNFKGKIFQFPGTKENDGDVVHLNSVFTDDKHTWVTAFRDTKRKDNEDWKQVNDGILMNIDTKQKIKSFFHPHSGHYFDHDIYHIESKAQRVYKNLERWVQVEGSYLRGMAFHKELILVGGSGGRHVSRSTGNKYKLWEYDKCGIFILNRNGKLRHFIDLSDYGREIYEVLLIDR